MKKLIIALVALFTITASAGAMSYEQARRQALFLTDKMAYELNLTDDQYEAAYEINLDYLMTVGDYSDLYGVYWERRNLDLSYILRDWQYRMYREASYFYRPLYWDSGYWHFGIYARYPYRDYFYFGMPRFYTVYRGGHSWHVNGGRSWYYGRRYGMRVDDGRYYGMRDGYNRGDYQRYSGNISFGNGPRRGRSVYGNGSRSGEEMRSYPDDMRRYDSSPNRSGGGVFGNRQSSTRTTVTRPDMNDNGSRSFGGRNNIENGSRGGGSFGGGRRDGSVDRTTVPNETFTPNRSSSAPSRSYDAPNHSSESPNRSFGSPNRSGSFGQPSVGSVGSQNSAGNSQNSSGVIRFGGRR